MLGKIKSDAAFFRAFQEHSAEIVEAARLLGRMLNDLDHKQALARAVKDAESRGDRLTHSTITKLHETWITPLDRDDIHNLIGRLDDVLDYIEAVARHLVLFDIREVRPFVRDLAEVLERECEHIQRAMWLVPKLSAHSNELLDLCTEIDRLEHDADELHGRATAELFAPGTDPVDVIKWHDILDGLESATDRCEDVANILEGIVLDYA